MTNHTYHNNKPQCEISIQGNIYLYTLAVSPSLGGGGREGGREGGRGVADTTKKTTKTLWVTFRCSSNDEGPSRVWMALLEI